MKYTLTVIVLICFFHTNAQEFKSGKIDQDWFEKTLTEEQLEAPAVFLEKYRDTNFEYRDNLDGWTLFTTIHNVIKINNTEGLEYGTHKVVLQHQGRQEEKIDRIEAYSYSNSSAGVERTKMSRSEVIDNKLNKWLDEKVIVIPNVKVGDIIEYSYRVESTYWHIKDLNVQEDIPVLHAYAKIAIPQFFDYNVYVKGDIQIVPKLSVAGRTENFSTEDKNPFGGRTQRTDFANIRFKENISEFEFSNVSPIIEEEFTNNIENFRSAVLWELGAVEMSKGDKVNRAKTWDQVADYYYEQLELSDNLESTNFLDESAQALKSKHSNQVELIEAVYRFIQNKMTWDEKEYNYDTPDLRKAFKDGSGSSYEINVLLVALLKKVGLNSSPVMASTKSNGVPLYPTVNGFNYVLAAVVKDNEWLVMDATEKNAIPGLLPERIMNWEGRLVKQNGTSKGIPLFAKKFSSQKTMVIASVNTEGVATGKLRASYSNNLALSFVNIYKSAAASTREKMLAKEFESDLITNPQFKFGTLPKSSTVSFAFEDDTSEIIGDKLYILPQLFLSATENPFTLEKRSYSIDFSYPKQIENVVTLNLPVGYAIASLPEAIEINLPGNMGVYRFKCSSATGTSVQVVRSLSINTTLIDAEMYNEIKKFFAQIVNKEKETIVLIKE